MPRRTSLVSHEWIRNYSTHSNIVVSTPRLTWHSSARARHWSVAAHSWSTTSGERSSLSGLAFPSVRLMSFHKKAPSHIPEALWAALEPILETIGSLTQRSIREYDRQLQTVRKEHYYPQTELLSQV
jgi:hypothetical protein